MSKCKNGTGKGVEIGSCAMKLGASQIEEYAYFASSILGLTTSVHVNTALPIMHYGLFTCCIPLFTCYIALFTRYIPLFTRYILLFTLYSIIHMQYYLIHVLYSLIHMLYSIIHTLHSLIHKLYFFYSYATFPYSHGIFPYSHAIFPYSHAIYHYQARGQLFTRGINFSQYRLHGAPQVHAGTYFLNRLQEDATSLHGCRIFTNKLQGALQIHMRGSYLSNTEVATRTVHKALSTYSIV